MRCKKGVGGGEIRFLQCCLLVSLRETPGYGYALAADIGRFGMGSESIDIGITYRALRILEAEGFVQGSWNENSLGPQRKMYRITSSGELVLAEWMKGLSARKNEIEELEKAFSESAQGGFESAEGEAPKKSNSTEVGFRRDSMKIAVTAESGEGLDSLVAHHFGQAPYFVLVDVENGGIGKVTSVANPFAQAHAPGDIPSFVKGEGVDAVVSGGMGSRAIGLFARFGIKSSTGADGTVRQAVEKYLGGALPAAAPCSDDEGQGHDHHGHHDHGGHSCH